MGGGPFPEKKTIVLYIFSQVEAIKRLENPKRFPKRSGETKICKLKEEGVFIN